LLQQRAKPGPRFAKPSQAQATAAKAGGGKDAEPQPQLPPAPPSPLEEAQASRLRNAEGEVWPGRALTTRLATLRQLADRALSADEGAEVAAQALATSQMRARFYSEEAQKMAELVKAESAKAIEASGHAAAAASNLSDPGIEVSLPTAALDASTSARSAAEAAANVSEDLLAYKAADRRAAAASKSMQAAAGSILSVMNKTIEEIAVAAASIDPTLHIAHIAETTTMRPNVDETTTTMANSSVPAPAAPAQPPLKQEEQAAAAAEADLAYERQHPQSLSRTTAHVLAVVAATMLVLAVYCCNKPISS